MKHIFYITLHMTDSFIEQMKSDFLICRLRSFWAIPLFALPLSVSCQTNPRWQWLNPLPQGNRLTDIAFIDSATAIAVGRASTIMKTRDVGSTWDIKHNAAETHQALSSIAFANRQFGLLVGDSGTVLRTMDSGTSWNQLPFPVEVLLTDIAYPEASTAFALSRYSSIGYKTTDAGIHWDSLSLRFVRPSALTFVNSRLGFILDAYGIVHRTTNAGITWSSQQIADSFATLRSISFADTDVAFIVGFSPGDDTTNRGTICLRTTDAGVHWTRQSFRAVVGVRDIATLDSNTAVSIMSFDGEQEGPIIMRTTSGGRSWHQPVLPPSSGTSYLERIVLHKSGLGFAVGDFGYILKTTDGGVSWVELSRRLPRANYGINNTFVDSLTGTIVSAYGEIHRTTNAGQTWIRQTRDTTIRWFNAVHFVDSNFGVTVGSEGEIFRTTNSGSDWVRQTSPTSYWLTAIDFINQRVGNIAGGEGTFLRTTNGGILWRLTQIGDHEFSSVAFADSLTGIMSGWFGLIFKTTDGGVTWALKSQGLSTWFYDVTFVDQSIAVAVGSQGAIARSADRGETWLLISSGTQSYLYSVNFFDKRIGLAAGEWGTVLYTKDGGLSWETIRSATSNYLTSVSFLTSRSAIATGEGGTILRLTLDEPLSVGDTKQEQLPEKVELFQNYPNPFNPSTIIRFSLPSASEIKLVVFDILGREIHTLVNGHQQAGYHSIEWKPESLSSGIYFYQLQTPTSSITRKLLLLR